MMNFEFKKAGDNGLLVINDENLTQKRSNELKELLTWALHNSGKLTLNLKKV